MVMIDNQSKSSFIEVAKGSIGSFYCGFLQVGMDRSSSHQGPAFFHCLLFSIPWELLELQQ